MLILGAIIFGLTRMLDGRDWIPRWAVFVGIPLGWFAACPIWYQALIGGLVTATLLVLPWCLIALDPSGPRNWEEKFKPTKWFGISKIKDNRLYGAAGMAIRWAVFIPLSILARGWWGLIAGPAQAIAAASAYYIGGFFFYRHQLAVMLIVEFSSAFIMGLAVLPTKAIVDSVVVIDLATRFLSIFH